MASDPKLSFEFYPPQTEEGVRNLKNTASELNKFNPEFFSVTFGAGGSTKEKTLDTVLALGKSIVQSFINCLCYHFLCNVKKANLKIFIRYEEKYVT